MLRFAVIAVLALSVALAAGCNGPRYNDPNELLPPDWPLNQLSMPREARLAGEPVALHEDDPEMETREWVVAFSYGGNWPGLVQHVEACLKSSGFYRQKVTRGPAGVEGDQVQTYYSPDFKTEVVVGNGAGVPGMLDAGDAEFALWVIVRPEPNEVIRQVLEVREKRPRMGETLLDGIIERIE